MQSWDDFSADFPDGVAVCGCIHRPTDPSSDGIILTHGAGANCRSPLLLALADELCNRGLTVLRFDLPFRIARPHGPPSRGSADRDQLGIKHAIDSMRGLVNGRLFAGGHSYGGRQTSMLAATDPGLVDGLLLLSYPLHPPQRPTQLRTAHFPTLQAPALFVHGTKDGFGSIEEMSSALKLIPSTTRLLPIAGAGHELLSKKNQHELPKQIVDEFRSFFEIA